MDWMLLWGLAWLFYTPKCSTMHTDGCNLHVFFYQIPKFDAKIFIPLGVMIPHKLMLRSRQTDRPYSRAQTKSLTTSLAAFPGWFQPTRKLPVVKLDTVTELHCRNLAKNLQDWHGPVSMQISNPRQFFCGMVQTFISKTDMEKIWQGCYAMASTQGPC